VFIRGWKINGATRRARSPSHSVDGAEVPVTRYEDGTADKQVDALIHYSDFEAALEVVADHDAKFNRQEDAFKRIEDHIQVSGLRDSWTAVIQPQSQHQEGQSGTLGVTPGLAGQPGPKTVTFAISNPRPRPGRRQVSLAED
jgi:hypothetical protein